MRDRKQKLKRTDTLSVCQDDYDTMGGSLLCDKQSTSWGRAGKIFISLYKDNIIEYFLLHM